MAFKCLSTIFHQITNIGKGAFTSVCTILTYFLSFFFFLSPNRLYWLRLPNGVDGAFISTPSPYNDPRQKLFHKLVVFVFFCWLGVGGLGVCFV